MANIIAALNANAALMSNAASNIANLNTRDYQTLRTAIVEDKNGEPSVITERSTTPGSISDDGHMTSNVDIPQEIGDMMLSQRGYEAALGAMHKRDEMLKDLMDLFA